MLVPGFQAVYFFQTADDADVILKGGIYAYAMTADRRAQSLVFYYYVKDAAIYLVYNRRLGCKIDIINNAKIAPPFFII